MELYLSKIKDQKLILISLIVTLFLIIGTSLITLAYFSDRQQVNNYITIGEFDNSPTVLVEWHDYVAEQDGTTVITRSPSPDWPPVMDCTTTKGDKVTKLNLYNANFTATDKTPWAWISSEHSDEYIKDTLEGTMLSIKSNGVSGFPGASLPVDVHVVEVVKDTAKAPETSGGKTYYCWRLNLGWLTTEVPASALEDIASYQPYQPKRENLNFTGWSKPKLKSSADGVELYETYAGWIEPESDKEIRMLWRDGQATGDTATFTRIDWNKASMKIDKADGAVKTFDIYSIGNDGTTDNPDIWCFFWDGYTEAELQEELNGAVAKFEGLLTPADAGYVINIYREYGSNEIPVKDGKSYHKYCIRLTVWPETTILESQMSDLRSVAPYTPVRDGYRFTGWSAPEAIGVDYYQTFAQWEREDVDTGEGTGRTYAAVYGNVLVFGKRTGEIPTDYQGIPLTEAWWDVDERQYSIASEVPWDAYRSNITEVTMRSSIRPMNTNYWFATMPTVKMELDDMDMSRCTTAASMFAGNGIKALDLRSWVTSNVANMDDMFADCTNLKTIYVSTRWSTATAGDDEANDMFAGCTSLVGGNGHTFNANYTGTKMAVIDTDMSPGYLTLAPEAAYAALYSDGTLVFGRGDETPLEYQGATLVNSWFGIEENSYTADTVPWRKYVWEVLKVRFDSAVSPVSTAYWFNAMRYLEDVDLTGLDMSNTVDAQGMFKNCANVNVVDMSVVDTSNVRYWASIFYGCTSLTSMDLSANNMDSAEGIGQFFYGDENLQWVKWPTNWDTTKLLRMNDTFRSCKSLTELDLSMFETPNLTRINGCFYDCVNLKTIYTTDNFVTDKVVEYINLFNNCHVLTGQNGTLWNQAWSGGGGLTYARIDRPGEPGMFTEKKTGGGDEGPGGSEKPEYPDDKVGRLMASMTLKEKVCQMFCVYPENLTAETGAPTLTVMGDAQKATLADYPFGGICAFLPNIQTEFQAKTLISEMQAASKIPMLTGIDEEGGRVQRIGGTTYDGAVRGAGIGYQLNAMQTYEAQGASVAFENAVKLADNCARLGFNWDFAPVADVNSNPANTIIGARAYSSDYGTAATLISSAIEGFASKNVGTSIKHFPGHGDTSTDSHVGAASVTKTKEQLLEQDLVPFAAGIAAGADSVMIGHLTVPELDGEKIATVSSIIVTDLLRNEMGFKGVITTDGMQMGALTNVYGKTQQGYVNATLACLDAGIDVFLLPGYPRAGVDAIVSRVEAGTISEERIDDSVRRILLMKEKLGLLKEFE